MFRQIGDEPLRGRRAHRTAASEGELSVDRFGELWARDPDRDARRRGRGHRRLPHLVVLHPPLHRHARATSTPTPTASCSRCRSTRRYEDEGDASCPRYLDLLRAGGSMPPEELGRIVGFDLADPGFWDGGLDLIEDQLRGAEEAARAGRAERRSEPQDGRNVAEWSEVLDVADVDDLRRLQDRRPHRFLHRAVRPGVVDEASTRASPAPRGRRPRRGRRRRRGRCRPARRSSTAASRRLASSASIGRLGRLQHRSALAVSTSRPRARRSAPHIGCRRSTTSAYSGSGDATSSRSKGRRRSRSSSASETVLEVVLGVLLDRALEVGPPEGRPRARRPGCARIAVVDVADPSSSQRVPANSRPWRRLTSSTASAWADRPRPAA